MLRVFKPMQLQTIDLPPLDFRAAIGPVNVESRTVNVVFSTGADALRMDWRTGQRYIERLSLDPKHVQLKRLNAGAPLLDTHSAYSIARQFGVVESGAVDGKKGHAAVRFSKRAEVEPFFQDVVDGVIRNVSVGYLVHRYEETVGRGAEPAVRLATDWEPYEISLTPMNVDADAQVRLRSQDPQLTHRCLVVRLVSDADRDRRLRLARARR
jgi:hypothetical protein